ncbi:MAG: hypothetical protein DMG94_10015 [Acidobacteria bacterium]|nr:MAG: hypothetical protein DMG94_10015 [Acidobacteriota bacterium]
MSVSVSRSQIHFLSLQAAIFCVQCELISANTTPRCLACGSKAVLSLSRLFGGSLRSQPVARVIEDDELNRLVRDLLRTVPSTEIESELERPAYLPARHHAREVSVQSAVARDAAIALRKGSEVICRARAGRTAPDIGVRLQTDSGISAECMRRGEAVLCHDAEDNPEVDLASCRRLGVRSILAAPLLQFQRTVGIFEVLSAVPNAFDQQDVATMQLLSSMMVTAIARVSAARSVSSRQQ